MNFSSVFPDNPPEGFTQYNIGDYARMAAVKLARYDIDNNFSQRIPSKAVGHLPTALRSFDEFRDAGNDGDIGVFRFLVGRYFEKFWPSYSRAYANGKQHEVWERQLHALYTEAKLDGYEASRQGRLAGLPSQVLYVFTHYVRYEGDDKEQNIQRQQRIRELDDLKPDEIIKKLVAVFHDAFGAITFLAARELWDSYSTGFDEGYNEAHIEMTGELRAIRKSRLSLRQLEQYVNGVDADSPYEAYEQPSGRGGRESSQSGSYLVGRSNARSTMGTGFIDPRNLYDNGEEELVQGIPSSEYENYGFTAWLEKVFNYSTCISAAWVIWTTISLLVIRNILDLVKSILLSVNPSLVLMVYAVYIVLTLGVPVGFFIGLSLRVRWIPVYIVLYAISWIVNHGLYSPQYTWLLDWWPNVIVLILVGAILYWRRGDIRTET